MVGSEPKTNPPKTEIDLWTDTNDEGLTFHLWVVDDSALIVELSATPDASFITETLAQPGNS